MNGFSAPEIEQAAISAMMQFPDCMNAGVEMLSEQHFAVPANRTIYTELVSQWTKGERADLIVFTERLRQSGVLEKVGGVHYVTQTWANTCHSPDTFPFYRQILHEELSKRAVSKTCSDIANSDLRGVDDPVAETITRLTEIPQFKRNPRTFREAMMDKVDRMENGEPDKDIIKTGLEKLDRQSPLRRGDMPLIAGERKSGKSCLALTIASNVARQGKGVVYFSLEDREPKVIDRIFAGISRIPMHAHHVSKLSEGQMQSASAAVSKLADMPISIRDDVFDLSAIVAASRQAVGQNICDLIIVDYAQLVRVQKSDSRREEVEKVSRDLRLLAMELNTPILLVAQLNKDGETRETKALEMDATAMWMVHGSEDRPTERHIRIPWQRNGESGLSFPVTFLGEFARFENMAIEREERAA